MKKSLFIINVLVGLALVLSACNFPVYQVTEEVGSIETSVAQTVSALSTLEATELPVVLPTLAPTNTLVVPTNTEMPTMTSTTAFTATLAPSLTPPPTATLIPSLTPIPSPCNRAEFMADVTVPDNTRFDAGSSFVKTWRLKNTGSCTWTTAFSLSYHSGSTLSAPAAVALPGNVAPGQNIDLSVTLKAPSADGTYTSYWMLKNASGGFFGIGANASSPFWVKIIVGDAAVATTVSNACTIVSKSPANGTVYAPNATFDTRWKVKNTSGKTWSTNDVDVRYISGTKWYDNGIDVYDLEYDVAPNAEYELILDSKAPAAVGTYTMTWGIVGGGVNCSMTASIQVK